MHNDIKYYIVFVIKTLALFGFIYEFRLNIAPSPLFSSRKIVFVCLVAFFFIRKCRVPHFFKENDYKRLYPLCIACFAHAIFLSYACSGAGTSIQSWFVYFFMYAVLGTILIICFYDYNLGSLIKSLALVTVFQSVWCILTFYIYDFRVINDMLFVLDENENIDFLSMARLRSIGCAGATLSVFLSLSSYCFLYYIMMGKKVILNSCLYIFCAFATFLAGTTGMLIDLVSVACVLTISVTKKRRGIIFIIIALFSFSFFISDTTLFMDSDRYNRLIYKIVDLQENMGQSGTLQALDNQKVAPITFETIIGTGLSRGISESGLLSNHDGGYFRTYFGIGLIMAILFYGLLYFSMYCMMRKNASSPVFYLLLTYLLVCIIIEYKEPFMLKYIPFFLFTIFSLKVREDGGYNICRQTQISKST